MDVTERNVPDTVRFLRFSERPLILRIANGTNHTEVSNMTFGEKLKNARMEAGYTQNALANKLTVSRAAIAKWESDRGMPDVANLKAIAAALRVSMDYLLDDGSALDFSVTNQPIDLAKYEDGKKLSRLKKVEIKEQIIREEYPDAEIIRLTLTKIKNSKRETIADQAIGWFAWILGGIPLFGTQEFGKLANSFDQQFYLVNEAKTQYFVILTDEYLISRTLANQITDKKFEIGDRQFLMVGNVP
jgi:transcriptional regulator with XRE-family HTH domain